MRLTGPRTPVPRLLAVAVALSLVAPLLSVAPAAQAVGPCDTPANEIVAENCLPGIPAIGVGRERGRATRRSRASPPTSASTRAGPSTSRSTRRRPTTDIDIYRLGYYGGDGARLVDTIHRRPTSPATDQPDCTFERQRPTTTSSTAATGRVRPPGRCRPTRPRASTSPSPRATDDDGASHIAFIVRDDDGGSDLLFQTSDTTWQAYNRYGGYSLYDGPAPCPQGQLQPALHDPRRADRGLAVQRRVPDAPLARAQRLRRQLLHRRRLGPHRLPRSSSTRPSCRSATTSTGRPSSGRTSRRPATPASTSPSSAATRSTGRPAGSRARPTAAAPTTAPSSATRKATPRAASTTTAWATSTATPTRTPGPASGARTRPGTTAAGPRTP